MSSAMANDEPPQGDRKLRIVHVLRAPVGGLFRHVRDLVKEQVARGHQVGLVTDSLTGGAGAIAAFAQLEPLLELGLLRLPIQRQPSVLDLSVALKIRAHIKGLGIDVLHGHGAKGGLYARFPRAITPPGSPIRVYTPHGGSFSTTLRPSLQSIYMFIERLLVPFTDAYLFESSFVAQRFAEQIGKTRTVTSIVPNGISKAEFSRVEPLPDAADFLYVGELRWQKGIEVLIDAMASLTKRYGPTLRLLLVGSGPDKERFLQRTSSLGLSPQITFLDPMPAHEAFKLGRILVLPSQSESLPYIVLEAAGAQLPIVATDVGDIREVLAPYANDLIPPNDCDRLIAAMSNMLEKTPAEITEMTTTITAHVASRYTLHDMADAIVAVYHEAIDRKSRHQNIKNLRSLFQSHSKV